MFDFEIAYWIKFEIHTYGMYFSFENSWKKIQKSRQQ